MNGLNNLKRNKMEEIFEEFGEIGAPSMYEITKLVYEAKYGSDEDCMKGFIIKAMEEYAKLYHEEQLTKN